MSLVALNPYILNIINLALRAIKEHPHHDLNLGYRWRLYSVFGPKINEERSLGHKRRTYLSILATEYVFPIWNKEEPISLPSEPMNGILMMLKEGLINIDYLKPSTLVFITKQILSGNLQPTNDIWMQVADCIDFCQVYKYQYYGAKDTTFIEVAYAAAHTLEVALEDERFGEENIDFSFTEIDSQDPESDVAFYAASAYAGGPMWVPESDSQKRLEFWMWWLTEAVPTAYQAFS